MNNKGQGALEYLMTYGWALIVIAIVIGVLVFIMSTTTSGSNCTSDNTQLIYVDHAVVGSPDGVANGLLELRLQNAAGRTIEIISVVLAPEFIGTAESVTTPSIIVSGAEFDLISVILASPLTGATYRGTIIVTYTRGIGGITHQATITCTGTAA